MFYPITIPSPNNRADHAAKALRYDINIASNIDSITSESFHYLTARDYVNNYKAGKWTPTQVATAVIESITRSESASPPLRAYVHLNTQQLLSAAAASTERYRSNTSLGPLDGVPFAVKAETDVEGFNTTLGTSFFGAYK